MFDVIAIGELLIDFSQASVDEAGYPTLASHPGGAPANYLAALSKFGKATALIAKVGNDAFGKLLVDTVEKAGINTDHISFTDECFTTLAFVTHDENGDRSFSFARKPGADTALSFDEIDLSVLSETKVVHFGTVGMTDEPSRTAHKRFIEKAKESGCLISFDPNLREPLWHSLKDAEEAMLWGLSVADVVKISDNEVDFLFGMDPEDGANHILSNYPVKLVLVTLGKEGALYANRIACGTVPNFAPSAATVDTTGAGDIFGGSFMYRLLECNTSPDKLTDDQLRTCCSFACKSASLSTARMGGISSVPDLKELI